MKTYRVEWMSPVGRLHLLANSRALLALAFDGNRDACFARVGIADPQEGDNWVTALAKRELAEYFAGERIFFSVPVELKGTAFQQRVWQALRSIPYGRTISYREQAGELGQETAVRATGTANGCNPVAIIVPCHRVVRSDGSLGGYAGGLEIKATLLRLERGA